MKGGRLPWCKLSTELRASILEVQVMLPVLNRSIRGVRPLRTTEAMQPASHIVLSLGADFCCGWCILWLLEAWFSEPTRCTARQ